MSNVNRQHKNLTKEKDLENEDLIEHFKKFYHPKFEK